MALMVCRSRKRQGRTDMPRVRRTLTNADIPEMAFNTRSARGLRAHGPECRSHSIAHTAGFLWLAFGLTVLALAGTYVWEWYRSEQDCNDLTSPAARIECTQRGEGKPGREAKKVRHGGMVSRVSAASYVRGGLR